MAPPFLVQPDEKKLYDSLKKRDFEPPLVVDVPTCTDGTGEFGEQVLRMIRNAGLERWVGFREKAYPRLMLEFYTSLAVSGRNLQCRIRGVFHEFTPDDITRIFGFDAGSYPNRDPTHEHYFRQIPFWDSIRVPGVKPTNFPMTAVKENPLYFIHRLVTRCIYGKEESTNLTQSEIEFLHAVKYNHNILIWDALLWHFERVAEVKKGKNSNPSHGTFITILAKSTGWLPDRHEEKTAIEPVFLVFHKRLIRNPRKPKSRGKWYDICKIVEFEPYPDPPEAVLGEENEEEPEAPDDMDDEVEPEAPDDMDDEAADHQGEGDMIGSSSGAAPAERAVKRPARPEMHVPADFWIDWEGWKKENAQEHQGIRDEFLRQDVTINGTYQETRRINRVLDIHEVRQLEIIAGHTRLTTRLDQVNAQYAQILAGQEEQRHRDERNESARQRAEQRAEARAEQMMELFARHFGPHSGGSDDR
ncbi:hypothetical protein CASFOL_034121 [Castilleja foliolosa]|uniref:Uncharacterized protein n=1 Tax=Castilleja foliolosa TaxID=1961234 RepID=A0ABD3BZ35_9LAMI